MFFFACVSFHFCFVFEKKFFTFGQVKGNARDGRDSDQPKFSSLQSQSCDPEGRNNHQPQNTYNQHTWTITITTNFLALK